MHLKFITPAVVLSSFFIASAAHADILAFDDITSAKSLNLTSTAYAGLSWTNVFLCRDNFLLDMGITSGLDQGGVTSGHYGIYNEREGYALVQSTNPFDFYGGDFSSAFKNNASLTLEGYRVGDPIGTISTAGIPSLTFQTTISATTVTEVTVNFTNIVALKILADHTPSTTFTWPAQDAGGDFFVLDNMAVSVPEPATLSVLAITVPMLLRRKRS